MSGVPFISGNFVAGGIAAIIAAGGAAGAAAGQLHALPGGRLTTTTRS